MFGLSSCPMHLKQALIIHPRIALREREREGKRVTRGNDIMMYLDPENTDLANLHNLTNSQSHLETSSKAQHAEFQFHSEAKRK